MKTKLFQNGIVIVALAIFLISIIKNIQSSRHLMHTETTKIPIEKISSIPNDAEIIFKSIRHKLPPNPKNPPTEADFEIFAMKKDSSGVTRITYNNLNEEHFSVSPDRKKIVVMVKDKGEFFSADRTVWIYDIENQLRWQLVPNFYRAGLGGVDWGSNSEYVYFAAQEIKNKQADIYKVNVDGSQVIQLTDTPFGEYDMSLSNDGNLIAYIRLVPVGNPPKPKTQVWIMDSNGQNQRMVDDGGQEFGMCGGFAIGDFDPEFNLDNTQIVFGRTNTKGANCKIGAFNIYVVNVDGTGLTKLTNSQGIWEGIPDWSKDNWIVYWEKTFDPNDQYDGISIIKADGSAKRRLDSNLPFYQMGGKMPKWINPTK